jgi:uracil-DNA glycosylase
MNRRSLLAAYLRQQKDRGMPDMVFGQADKVKQSLKSIVAPPQGRLPVKPQAGGALSQKRPVPAPDQSKSPYGRLSKLAPPVAAVAEPKTSYSAAPAQAGLSSFSQKRAVFKELFTAECDKCALGKSRTKFVFGAGNVDAPLMIIGEAPGAEEDAQGLPFVGAAGRLLTELLTAVALDRKKDVFITNILKCRPPDNRTPDAVEVAACLPLLQKQIQVIAPRLLLLLGRIAAHALLDTADSIGKLRGRIHDYSGIPVIVTYHPAAILRNPEYRGPTMDDLQKAVKLSKESGQHGTS